MMEFTLTDVEGAEDGLTREDELYDTIIVGGGPGGLTAALYCGRYRMKTLLLEREIISGGQMVTTEWVENYPGFEDPILGNHLAQAMEKHALRFGTTVLRQEVKELRLEGEIKEVVTDKKTYKTKTVVLSTGASSRKLGVPGETEYRGKGVSYCATCDGPFYPDKTIAVVGGGNTALQEALFLAKYAKKIYLLHRREEFRADKVIQERFFRQEKIEFIPNSVVKEICFGEAGNKYITAEREKDGEKEKFTLPVEAVFIFIGMDPNTKIIPETINRDSGGYIVTDEEMNTSIPGVYAVGDLRSKSLRQIATSVGDGALAAHSANLYLQSLE